MTAGTAIDALGNEFSRSEAAFIEWHAATPANRKYMLSESGGGQYVPEVMVDSARLFMTGAGSGVINDYRAMINNSQARPPLAELSATVTNNGSSVTFNVTVKNNSTITLSSANKAAVHGLVYEDYRQSKTNFAGRGSAKADITSLAPGASADFTITVPISGVKDPSKLNYVALVDYKAVMTKDNIEEDPDNGLYDQLNAIRIEPPFYVSPTSLEFNVKSNDATMPEKEFTVGGDAGQTWTASVDQDFVTMSSDSGSVPETVLVSVDKSKLKVGENNAIITVTDSTGEYTGEIAVKATLILTEFSVVPNSVTFKFASGDPVPTKSIMVKGDSGQTWKVSANQNWLKFNPATGEMGKTFVITVDRSKLKDGYQEGIVTVSDNFGYHNKEIKVKVTYTDDGTVGDDFYLYLPYIVK